MVPQVDVKDTEVLLTSVGETAEAVRKEILGWVLPKEQTSNDAEAQALRKLAARSAQQTRQWTGRMLGELGTAYPYPNSSDGSTQIIDKTAVPEKNGLELPADATVVQKIKHTRGVLSGLKGQLEVLVTQCIPGTPFNQYLFKVQEHALQTSMWLGELLHEFYEAQPMLETPGATNISPQHSPEVQADIAAVQKLGTRVSVNNFVEGKSLPGLIIQDPNRSDAAYIVLLDELTPNGVQTIALRPTVADAIRDYQIVREFTAEETAADLAKIQADSEPGDQFKANLQAAVAKAESYDAGPRYSPEALADIAAVESVGTRVLVNNFAEGKSLAGTIIMDEDDKKRVCHFVQLDSPTESGVAMIALRPTVADAIRDYQIVSEAVVSGEFTGSPSTTSEDLTKADTTGAAQDSSSAHEASVAVDGSEVHILEEDPFQFTEKGLALLAENPELGQHAKFADGSAVLAAETIDTPEGAAAMDEAVGLSPNGNVITKKSAKSVRK